MPRDCAIDHRTRPRLARSLAATALLVAACPAPSPPDAGPPVERDVPDLGDYNVPPGFALTPFLSAAPLRTFDAAGAGTEPGRDYRAVLDTDAGRIVVDLLEREAPVAVNSFVWLARNHYFDLLQFHRVLEGFIAQGGDPLSAMESARAAWGTGGPGYTFAVEVSPDVRFDAVGVVGMSRRPDAGMHGSQFFITLRPAPPADGDGGACGATLPPPRTVLDGCYTAFGRVVDDSDGGLGRFAYGQPPALPTRMIRVFIIERPS